MSERKTPTETCRFHCRGCGNHFTSLDAFDMHRSGPMSERVCLDPLDALDKHGRHRFEVVSEEAECRMHVVTRTACTLYGAQGARARVRSAFGRQSLSDSAQTRDEAA